MVDIETLRTELSTDPKNIGYAPLVEDNQDAQLVELLNATTGNGAEEIDILNLDHDTFVLHIAPIFLELPNKDEAIQKKWDRMLTTLVGLREIGVGTPQMQGIFSALVSDGLLTQEYIDSFTKRVGSRAENIFGENITVTQKDVAMALRNADGTGAI